MVDDDPALVVARPGRTGVGRDGPCHSVTEARQVPLQTRRERNPYTLSETARPEGEQGQ